MDELYRSFTLTAHTAPRTAGVWEASVVIERGPSRTLLASTGSTASTPAEARALALVQARIWVDQHMVEAF